MAVVEPFWRRKSTACVAVSEVPSVDPASFTVAAGVLLLAAGVAVAVPAWRAARLDPAPAVQAQ